ncbi:MAG: alpha-1,4-glucan--maltose-1-phosphate maltosyltransferase [Chloroflexota bacterium]|nr:alpha-1,4-glucan--maltose-1-phosphate maltosyltransferase [Dehalococcoidia bacterium]MDW8252537.1 alpha-1,4-glucan--maltose-1-phosphate maltosyltransferase [Chloroflexota bacterium]
MLDIAAQALPERAETVLPPEAQSVVIEGVWPEIDAGRFAIKRTVGEQVVVEADIFTYGHEQIAADLIVWHGDGRRRHVPMTPIGNDRWRAAFPVEHLGEYRYTIIAWRDCFATWASDLAKRVAAGQDVRVDLEIGARLVDAAAARATGRDAKLLAAAARTLRAGRAPALDKALSPQLAALMRRWADRTGASRYPRDLSVWVDRERARFSAWYELFPRSYAATPGEHGTFADLERHLDYVAEMGFDVLYLPPIHPIGTTKRKGRNNAPVAAPGDPGSPWAIGSAEGGHKAIHPQLGTLKDFRRLLAAAKARGLEIALDLAFQCSPDHPYVKEHPEWFRWRPDGTVQYAENPPKKYEDIYPFEFELPEPDRWALWRELLSIVEFWCEQGVRIFRVDNPHTKPFRFWEWLIAEIRRRYPETIFLSEAFTRPKVMYHLAKLGFTQSYTYFAWRTTRWELTEYLTELTQGPVREFFRPNFWPNTPDILTEQLQHGGRPAFMARLILAATLSSNYGIYGPAFELGEHVAVAPGKEEYLHSEKYEIKHWDLDRPDSLKPLIARVNAIRRAEPALQYNDIRFHDSDNDQFLIYSKRDPSGQNVILVVVNLDPVHTQAGWTRLAMPELGLAWDQAFVVRDLLTEARYHWRGPHNYVELNPHVLPAHIFLIEPAE